MPSSQYNITSVDWQTREAVRRFREWAEYQLSRTDIDLPELPEWSWPEESTQLLFLLLASLLALWIVWLVYQAFEVLIQQWLGWDKKQISFGSKASSLEADCNTQDWWQQAQVLAQQHDYAGACKALYGATLQQLHESRTLPHNLSRTDGEYIETLHRSLGKMPRPYQLLIGTHERLTFGEAIASAEMFQRCCRAYEEIQRNDHL